MYLTEYHHHTDYYSVNPVAPMYGDMDFTKCFLEIEACRQAFHGELIITAGIELCEPHLNIAEYDQELKGLELDLIMGSMHNIKEDKLRIYMSHKEHHDVYQGYFEEVYALVSNVDIDVLAHLDLIARVKAPISSFYLYFPIKSLIIEEMEFKGTYE